MEPHDVIYLQTGNEFDGIGNSEYEGVTWAHNKINDGDTKYLLATPVRESAEELQRVLRDLIEAAEKYYFNRVRGTSQINTELQSAIHEAQEISDNLPYS